MGLVATLVVASVGRADDPPSLAEAGRALAQSAEATIAVLDRLAPGAAASPEARYLRARAESMRSAHDEAARLLAGLETTLPLLAADVLRRRAEALAFGGHMGEAEAAYQLLASRLGGAERELAVARAAECALAAGAASRAIPTLRQAIDRDVRGFDPMAASMALAEAELSLAHPDEAARVLRRALVRWPAHPSAPDVERVWRELEPRAELSPDERFLRADRLHDARRHRDAVRELDAIPASATSPPLVRRLHLRGHALFRTRFDYAEAARVLARAAALGGPHVIEDTFHAARALSRSNQDSEAIVAYRRLVRAHPESRWAAEAEYLAAWLEMRLGRREAAERALDRFLQGPRSRLVPEQAQDAAFELGMSAFRSGRHREAEDRFARYAMLDANALVRSRGLYWAGRSAQEANARGRAVTHFRQTIRYEPLHWYALLARERLEQMREAPGDPFGAPAAPEPARVPLAPPTLPPRAALYHRLGLDGEAAQALRQDEGFVRRQAPAGRESELLARAYLMLDRVDVSYQRAVANRDVLRRRPTPATQWIWEAAYPLPYRASMEGETRRNGMLDGYLFAIMRQESGFDPDDVSYADAMGLLQMIPPTTRRLCTELGIRYADDLLFDPEWNIRLGALYIGRLYRSFGEQLPWAIGAYNAGPRAMARWVGERGELDTDLFVETIPFDQTRNYVRRVTTSLARYRWMQSPTAEWPLRIPIRLDRARVRMIIDY